jgi:hypothetical protein
MATKQKSSALPEGLNKDSRPFFETAITHATKEGNRYHLIEKNTKQWWAWLNYLERVGKCPILSWLRLQDQMTMPAEWPSEFHGGWIDIINPPNTKTIDRSQREGYEQLRERLGWNKWPGANHDKQLPRRERTPEEIALDLEMGEVTQALREVLKKQNAT